MNRTVLYVTGFSPNLRARDLAYEFERYGRLVRCDIPALKSASSSPFAFIEFRREYDAEDAYYDMHGRSIDGRRITVQWAKRPPSSAWRHDGVSSDRRRDDPPRRDDRDRRDYDRRDDRYGSDRDSGRDRDRDYDRRRSPDRDADRRRSLSPVAGGRRSERGRSASPGGGGGGGAAPRDDDRNGHGSAEGEGDRAPGRDSAEDRAEDDRERRED